MYDSIHPIEFGGTVAIAAIVFAGFVVVLFAAWAPRSQTNSREQEDRE